MRPSHPDPDDTQRLRLVREGREQPSAELVLADDPHEALGQVMAEVMKISRATRDQGAQLETFARELGGMRRDIELDRSALVRGASKRAASRSSNRVAALLGMLYILGEHVWPFVSAFWKVHR